MHTIDDQRLEGCRRFLTRATPVRSHDELLEIVRDLTWAVEELQFRRLQERTAVKIEPDDRPFLLFGSDEAILKFVEDSKVEEWQAASDGILLNVLPRAWRARKLDGADEDLWKKWEELCRTYDAKPEESA